MAEKTNALRMAERAGVEVKTHTYAHEGGAVDGVTVAKLVGKPCECVFKTLVTQGATGGFYVFVIPVDRELHLKKAATAFGEKSVHMIKIEQLLPLTGYVRGGCSPIGMKKRLPTVIDQSAKDKAYILVSAGRIGTQMEMTPEALCQLAGGKWADIT